MEGGFHLHPGAARLANPANWGDLSAKQKWQAARPANILRRAASVAPSPPLQHIRQTNGAERGCKTLAIKRPSVSHTSWGAARFLLPKQVWDCFAKELRRYREDRWARLGFACCGSGSDESVAFLRWHSVRRQKGEWNKRALVLCPDLLGEKGREEKKKEKKYIVVKVARTHTLR